MNRRSMYLAGVSSSLLLALVVVWLFGGGTISQARVAQTREVKLIGGNAIAGQNFSVGVDLVSLGNENALGFSLNFNQAILTTPVVTLGADAAGATLNANTTQSASGRIGIAIALPTNQAFIAGTRRVAVITFTVAASAPLGNTPLTFGDQPIFPEISDPNASTLTVTYTPASINIQQLNPAPVATSLAPPSIAVGSAGFTLTVNGSGFVNGSTVQWNGNSRTTNFVSATQLTAAIPASDLTTAATASVTVVSPAPGGGTSAALTFGVNNPTPVVTTISPNTATTGSAGITLTVNGTGFVSGSTIRWNNSNRATTFVSGTQLTAQIPASDLATAGIPSVTVVTPAPGGGTSNATPFTITNGIPAITALNPTSIAAGSSTFTLTVTGTGFINGSTVLWNGNDRPTNFVSGTQLTATIAANDVAAVGNANVSVVTPSPGGGTSNVLSFAINAPTLTIATLTPNAAIAGSAGFTLTVTGSGFLNGATVRWNGSNRTTTFVSGTQLTAQIPASDITVAGTASVSVAAASGGVSNSLSFTINNPAPTIGGLSPASATAGSNGITLTVNGTGFVGGSTVRWNGSARATTFVSATQLTAAIPASDLTASGSAEITVANAAPGGGVSNASSFSILNGVPVLSTLSPNTVLVGGAAFTLTVNGSGFVSGVSARVNGQTRTATLVSATQLTVSINATDIQTAGTVSITAVNPVPGGGESNALSLAVNNPVPAITMLAPTSVLATSAQFTLTVNGTGFINGSTVQWNGSNRTTTFVSATQLRATISQTDIAAPGSGSITVINATPGGGTSNAVNLPVSQVPTAQIAVTPANPTVTDNISIQLSGTWPNSCVPQSPQFTVVGNEVRITTSNNGQACATVLTPWSQSVSLPAGTLAAGNYQTQVNHTSPFGQFDLGKSAFTVSNLAPGLTALNPNGAIAGGAAFTLTVTGNNFTNGSVIRWNDADRPTTFVSATQLRAVIPASDIAAAGAASVRVFTPAPGGGTTNALSFTIASSVASVSAASFLGTELTSESIVAAFGVNLATRIEVGNSIPLPTELAGTKVSVRDSTGSERLAPLFFVAPTQVNYAMPQNTANGPATVTITSGDGKVAQGTVQIAAVAPGLFAANANGQGVPAATVLRVKANGEQVYESLSRFDAAAGSFVPTAIDLGPEGEQVFLLLFGSGFRFNTGLSGVSVKIGGVDAEVLYAGTQGGFVGLDQSNVRLPRSLAGRGLVDVVMLVNGKAANTVRINVK